MIKEVSLVQFENGTKGYVLKPSVTTEVEGINGDGIVRSTKRSFGDDTSGYNFHYVVLPEEWDDHTIDSCLDAGWTAKGQLNVMTGEFALAS